MKIEILNVDLYSDGLSEIRVTINNNVLSFKRMLNIMLKLRDEKREIEMFNIDKIYQYDVTFLKTDMIYFYENKSNIENEIKSLIENEIKNIDVNKNDDEIINDFLYNLNDIEKKVVDKHNNFKLIKYNKINNKTIDLLTDDDINEIDEINVKEISFNKHMIKEMIEKREIKALNNLLYRNLTKKNHLRFSKHKKAVKKIRELILEKSKINSFKDEYNLKDYKYLDFVNDYYHNFYDDVEYYENINTDDDVEYYENINTDDAVEYYKNINTNDSEIIKLVYSLH